MSPELFDPENFGLKNSRPTKRSDCYALGMVIYEVLSRRVPFYEHANFAVVVRVSRGEYPGKPRGEERALFTDDIWRILKCCWKSNPGDRPRVKDVLECLERSSRSWMPPSQTMTNIPTTNSPTWNSDLITEGSVDEDEASFPSQAVSSQQSQKPPPEGDPTGNNIYSPARGFSALPDGSSGRQGLGAGGVNSNGLDLGESTGIPGMVSFAGDLHGYWC